MDIISVVLGADTKKDRTKDSIKIIEYCFSQNEMFDMKKILEREFKQIIENTQFSVIKGSTNELKLKLADSDISIYPVNRKKEKNIVCENEIITTLNAPIMKGDIIGKIKIKIEGNVIEEVDILCDKDISKKDVKDYFCELVMNLNMIFYKW